MDELLHHCLNAAGVPRGVAYLVQPDGQFSPRAQLGYSGVPEAELAEFFGHAPFLRSVMDAVEPVRGPSADVPEVLLGRAMARSILPAPLVLGEERLGVLVIAATGRELDGEWVPFAQLFGSQIAQAIGLARAFCRLRESEDQKKRFHREVIRSVTSDKLRLVDAEEIPTAGPPLFELSCEEPVDCRPLRERLGEAAESAGMRSEATEDLVLAAAEAATNAIKRAVEGRCAVYVELDRVVVRVSDRGKGIRAEDLPASLLMPGFSTKVSLGMGFTMMLKLVERIWMASGPGGTTVQIEKWFDPEQFPASQLLAAWE